MEPLHKRIASFRERLSPEDAESPPLVGVDSPQVDDPPSSVEHVHLAGAEGLEVEAQVERIDGPMSTQWGQRAFVRLRILTGKHAGQEVPLPLACKFPLHSTSRAWRFLVLANGGDRLPRRDRFPKSLILGGRFLIRLTQVTTDGDGDELPADCRYTRVKKALKLIRPAPPRLASVSNSEQGNSFSTSNQ